MARANIRAAGGGRARHTGHFAGVSVRAAACLVAAAARSELAGAERTYPDGTDTSGRKQPSQRRSDLVRSLARAEPERTAIERERGQGTPTGSSSRLSVVAQGILETPAVA